MSAEYLADDPASSSPFHFPVNAQLFLPESWIADGKRRQRTHVPAELTQQTKPEIALQLLDQAQEWGLPIQAVVADAGYGDNPNFLAGLDARRMPYICAVESTFGVRLPQEVQTAAKEVPAYGGRGQPRKPRPAPLYSVKQLIEALPESAWQTISWREGTKGTMQAQVVAIGVHWATGSARHSTSHSRVQTGPEGWLLAERPVSRSPSPAPSPDEASPPDEAAGEKKAEPQKEAEETKYWFSSLPPETSLEQLVTLAHARWVIEQFYEDAKQECGLDNFQGRRWDGLHRHLALVMLAYTFLALQRLTLPLPAGENFPPPQSHVARCPMCIGRCCSGSSRTSSSGLSRLIRSSPSALAETNEVVLALPAFSPVRRVAEMLPLDTDPRGSLNYNRGGYTATDEGAGLSPLLSSILPTSLLADPGPDQVHRSGYSDHFVVSPYHYALSLRPQRAAATPVQGTSG